ncbi:MAG: FAD-binding protein [Oscillibacter sp.]|nr:FAD-binding protein [Oscillibacter sp.]
MKQIKTDVLVAGAGFAGAIAAIRAAEAGAQVAIVSEDAIFSGSSFCKGAWGFGLMGPENQADAEDFARRIEYVGMGMTDHALVDYLVHHILGEVEDLGRLGLRMAEPKNKETEREYIPCFDNKVRSWFLFFKQQVRDALKEQFVRLGIQQLPDTEVIRLCRDGGAITGAAVIHRGQMVHISCGSVILASGGLAPMFRYRCGNDGLSVMGQALALDAGATLANLEFIQMIPGFISPHFRTLCNERAFRFSRFFDYDTGEPIMRPGSGIDWTRALDERSTHGPFSTRLYSRHVDIQLFEAFRRSGQGVRMRYDDAIKNHPSEFSDYYFGWLKEEKGLGFDDEIIVGNFYHASNGGVCIDAAASTGIPGLYACGEATTGMHGADRIGGMSLANSLVFGSAAGREAADFAAQADGSGSFCWLPDFTVEDAGKEMERILDLSFRHMMLVRDEQGLCQTLGELQAIADRIRAHRRPCCPQLGEDVPERYRDTLRLLSMVTAAQAAAGAMLLRRESRGSHYRSDYPEIREELGQRIVVRQGENGEPAVSLEDL